MKIEEKEQPFLVQRKNTSVRDSVISPYLPQLHRAILMLLGCIPLWGMGQFSIGQWTLDIQDPNRGNRTIPTEIFYPATSTGVNALVAAGEFPVIVFGHGFSMNYDPYQNFWDTLVPQGYIMVFPKTEIGPIPFPDHAALGQDISFLVDWMQAQGLDNQSRFYQKIKDKTAVMGHSMGGGCSFLAAESNQNVTVLAGTAPAETNTSAIAAAANITVPALIFGGTLDNVTPIPDHTQLMYNGLASNCKTFVKITDAAHCHYANGGSLCDAGEITVCIGCSFIGRPAQQAITFDILTPWFDFYLKGDCSQYPVFESRLANTSGITVERQCNYQLPTANIAFNGPQVICPEDSVTLRGSSLGDIIWSSGDTTAMVLVPPGVYSFTLTDQFGCQASDMDTVFEYAVIAPQIQYSASICAGDSTLATVSNDQFLSYEWSTGETGNILTISQPGDYYVSAVDGNGCASFSDTFAVIAIPDTFSPVLTLIDDTLFINQGRAVAWFFEGQQIPNFTNDFLLPLTDGEYSALVRDTTDCIQVTNEVTVLKDTALGLKEPGKPIKVYPNPGNGIIIVEGAPENTHLSLYNVTGRLVKEVRVSGIIELNLQPGVYMGYLQANGSFLKALKLVIQ